MPTSRFVPRGAPAVHDAPLTRVAAPPIGTASARARDSSARLFGDYSYVRRDLRRIALLTLAALVLLVALSLILPRVVV